jgi:hypothetical protein
LDTARASVRDPAPLRLKVTADDVATLHRRIPELVGRVRQQLSSSPASSRRDLVVDLSAVPPSPAVLGEVHYERPIATNVLSDDERVEGICLSCRAVPLTNVVIKLQEGDRLRGAGASRSR